MQLGFSDDGEPSGTAGKPILAQLMGSNVGEVCAVVTRYYGGIKLGTGGLVRAYSSGVRQGLLTLETELKLHRQIIVLEYAYDQQAVIEQMLQKFKCNVLQNHFAADVHAHIEVESQSLEALKNFVSNASKGKIIVKISDEKSR